MHTYIWMDGDGCISLFYPDSAGVTGKVHTEEAVVKKARDALRTLQAQATDIHPTSFCQLCKPGSRQLITDADDPRSKHANEGPPETDNPAHDHQYVANSQHCRTIRSISKLIMPVSFVTEEQ